MKKIALMALVGCFAGFASAAELWWMVADNATVVDGPSGEATKVTWDTAILYASANGYNYDGTQIESWTAADIAEWGYASSTIDTSAKSFYIELLNSGKKVGNSYVRFGTDSVQAQGATTSSDLAGAMYGGGMSMATPYTFTTFTTAQVVPEPTSGLLLLLGFAGLALRRKRA